MGFSECIRSGRPVLMEGALGERLKREYRLSFHPDVAMATLAELPRGRAALEELWRGYTAIAGRYGLPFLATTPTRRANRERMTAAGRDQRLIERNVHLLNHVRETVNCQMYVGGLMGCRGDAYTGEGNLPEAEAAEFHSWAAEAFQASGAEFLYAGIMPTLPEAAGMARAMEATGLPYLISFTIQKDGCLVDGTPIADAIAYIDAVTVRNPACYMTNCVHPSIVREALEQSFNQTESVRRRFLGIQANTSPLSYGELELATELLYAEPEELANDMMALREISDFCIFGGCCGTDARHIEAVAKRLAGQ